MQIGLIVAIAARHLLRAIKMQTIPGTDHVDFIYQVLLTIALLMLVQKE
jgi:hypothetical protein